ncbi:hypothetical protein [Desulfobacter hydrogenophilus]|nr:hypothetical protein [Desulfobacter hydrogenophilus]NDY73496.1 hypothetical protein [Desulfobacter hydrogenophilus]QBH15719.1 hypothetical protein EYB58_22880 [Desulfobacter hydrogenophilus]
MKKKYQDPVIKALIPFWKKIRNIGNGQMIPACEVKRRRQGFFSWMLVELYEDAWQRRHDC